MKRRTLPRSKRVRSSRAFTWILRRGGCAADDSLVVFALRQTALPASAAASPLAPRRLGVTIPKRTGNAVVRNRWKRWIREAFRLHQENLPRGFDYIVRPKKDAVGSGPRIQASLPKLARKAARRAERPPRR